jgi:hypothetical protein
MHPKTKLTIEVTDTQLRLMLVQLAERTEFADKGQGKPPRARQLWDQLREEWMTFC